MKTRVKCALSDCFYFHKPTEPGSFAEECDCSHPDKPRHLRQIPCPIYKKHWSKVEAPDLDKFRKLRRKAI